MKKKRMEGLFQIFEKLKKDESLSNESTEKCQSEIIRISIDLFRSYQQFLSICFYCILTQLSYQQL